MKIAVNTRLLLKNRLEGIGWFTYETMKRITQWHPEHEFFFLFDRDFDPEFIFSNNVKPVVLQPQSRHPILWYIWFEHSVRLFIKKNRVDLFVSPDGYLSLKSNVLQVGVIHDICFHHFPNTIPPFARWYYNYFFPKFAQRADRLATVSEFSKNDIVTNYSVNPEKIDIVYNGANELYTPLSPFEIESTRKRITSGSPYFVFVGAFNPRKNIIRLLLAFDQFKKRTQSDVKLVIVGDEMYHSSKMMLTYNDLDSKRDVLFTGRLQVDKLRKVIGSALAMTYVSYYEGFGIPLLEAMSCDIPILASNCTAIPEVVGNAAIFVDPFSIDSITEGMMRMEHDNDLRSQLVKNARIQCKKFSWDKTAQSLYRCMMSSFNK